MAYEDLFDKTRFWYKGSRVKNDFIEYLIGTDAKGEAGKLINSLYKNKGCTSALYLNKKLTDEA